MQIAEEKPKKKNRVWKGFKGEAENKNSFVERIKIVHDPF